MIPPTPLTAPREARFPPLAVRATVDAPAMPFTRSAPPAVAEAAPWEVREPETEMLSRADKVTPPKVERTPKVVSAPPAAFKLTDRPIRPKGAEMSPSLVMERDPAVELVTAPPIVTPVLPNSETPFGPVMAPPVWRAPPLALTVTDRPSTAPVSVTPAALVTWTCPLVAFVTPAPSDMACAAVRVTPFAPERGLVAEVVIPPVVAVKLRVEAVTPAFVEMPRPASRVRPPEPELLMAEETTTSL